MVNSHSDNPCDICHDDVITEFTVSVEVWTLVTGNIKPVDEYAPGYWCLKCFISKAESIADMDFTVEVHTRKQYYTEAIK